MQKSPIRRVAKRVRSESNWKTIEINGTGKLVIGTVDENIMQQMPSATETFIEREGINSFIIRVQNFLRTGK